MGPSHWRVVLVWDYIGEWGVRDKIIYVILIEASYSFFYWLNPFKLCPINSQTNEYYNRKAVTKQNEKQKYLINTRKKYKVLIKEFKSTMTKCNGVWEVVPKNERFKIISKDNIKHGTFLLKSHVSLRLYWRMRSPRLTPGKLVRSH